MTPAVATLSVSYDPYVRQGWHLVPIPPGSKGPRNSGWNKREHTITDPNQVPAGYGVGLAHAYSGTMALDIDDMGEAATLLGEHGIDVHGLLDAPDAVTIISGKSGHGKLIYAMPWGLVLPSKRITYQHDGQDKVAYELRCASSNGLTVQDVLPPSIHPEVLRPYQWGGRGHWQRLPTIPGALLDLWHAMTSRDSVKQLAVSSTVSASWDEVKAALSCIPADVGRQEWITVGMALHHAGYHTEQLDEAMRIWDDWSSTGTKYKGQREILEQWRSFKIDAEGVTLGSLFHLAKERGYHRAMVDVSSMFSAVTAPDLVFSQLSSPPPSVDLSVFPTVLAQRAQEISIGMGSDPLVSLFAGMAAVVAAADARTRLELNHGWEVPPVLWLMTIGCPAEKKTPASRPMFEPLKEIERADGKRYAQDLIKWEAHEAAHVSSKKAFHQAASDPANLLGGELNVDGLPMVHELPPRPVPLRLTLDDVTSQKLVRMIAERPQGMLCWLDEMRSWLDKLSNMRSGEDRSTWVRGYEAGGYTVDRVGDGTGTGSVTLDCYALGIYGNVQPGVLRTKLKEMAGDGLVQRFLPAILRDSYSKAKGEPLPAMLSNAAEYAQMIRRVHALPTMRYTLSPAAYNAFREFQDWYLQCKADERLLHASEDYMQAFGKLEGTAGRLILVWHLIESPYSTQVAADVVERVSRFVRGYVVPALRYLFGELAGHDADSLEQWTAAYVVQASGEMPTITMRDIKRSARRQIEGMSPLQADARIRDACYPLEKAGWLAVLRDDRAGVTWSVNPAIAGQHKARRTEVIKAKQRRIDALVESSQGVIGRKFTLGWTEDMDE